VRVDVDWCPRIRTEAGTPELSYIYTVINCDSFIMDANERIQAASQFLLQSPPGEINDVLNGTICISFSFQELMFLRGLRCSKHYRGR